MWRILASECWWERPTWVQPHYHTNSCTAICWILCQKNDSNMCKLIISIIVLQTYTSIGLPALHVHYSLELQTVPLMKWYSSISLAGLTTGYLKMESCSSTSSDVFAPFTHTPTLAPSWSTAALGWGGLEHLLCWTACWREWKRKIISTFLSFSSSSEHSESLWFRHRWNQYRST